jgi:tol-pal system protein YbgF
VARASVLTSLVIMTSASACASGQRAQRESEMATLRTHIEELKKNQEATARELGRLSGEIKALDAQATFLAGETKTANAELLRMKTALDDSGKAIGDLRTAIEELRKPVPAAPPPPAHPAPPSSAPESTAEQMFASAMASFQAEEHGQAVLEWSELMRRFAEHPLAATAQYWIGEAYYRQRDFRQAMIEFRKVIDGYAKSPQIPEALLKIGLCYRALKDMPHARDTWEQLAKEYPGTNAAAQARALLGAPAPSGRPAR